MPGISRVGTDSAGGAITGILAPSVFVNGSNVACLGASITPHGLPPHDAAVMAGSSNTVFANNTPVCRAGDLASCGHAASGSSDTFAG
jgi:uncharacterized Zn-binding protein involved in type VI secretion